MQMFHLFHELSASDAYNRVSEKFFPVYLKRWKDLNRETYKLAKGLYVWKELGTQRWTEVKNPLRSATLWNCTTVWKI